MFGLLKNLFASADNNELKAAIKEGAFLVDVRTPREFSGGSVKGAINISFDSLQNNLAKFKNKNNIVVFCRSGNRSAGAQSILNRAGFTNVINGGTWQNVNQVINEK